MQEFQKNRREKIIKEVFSGFTGSTGIVTGTTADNFRRHFRWHFRLCFFASGTAPEVAPEVEPELPVIPEVPACSAVLPLATSGASTAYENELLFLVQKWHRYFR